MDKHASERDEATRRKALADLERVTREGDVMQGSAPLQHEARPEAPDKVERWATWVGRGGAVLFLLYFLYLLATGSFG
jgi:hypothetical protein